MFASIVIEKDNDGDAKTTEALRNDGEENLGQDPGDQKGDDQSEPGPMNRQQCCFDGESRSVILRGCSARRTQIVNTSESLNQPDQTKREAEYQEVICLIFHVCVGAGGAFLRVFLIRRITGSGSCERFDAREIVRRPHKKRKVINVGIRIEDVCCGMMRVMSIFPPDGAKSLVDTSCPITE